MPKLYERAEFALPKVSGLAIHNARKRTEATEAEIYPWGRGNGCKIMHPFPPEVYGYCLFGVNSDCSVIPLASGFTASEIEPIIRKSNLVLLANKYSLIGFVSARTPKKTKEYDTISVPKEGKQTK